MAEPKASPKWPFPKPIGHIRLSGDELISFLRKYQSDEVEITAETNNHTFKSLQDMEENLPLLQGSTKVSIKYIDSWGKGQNIKFGYTATIEDASLGNNEDEDVKLLRQTLVADLKSLRTPVIWIFSLVPRFILWSIFLGVSIGSFIGPEEAALSKNELARFFEITLWFFFAVSVALGAVKPVYHLQRDTFWRRNRDTIITGVVMLIIGILSTHFAPSILEMFPK